MRKVAIVAACSALSLVVSTVAFAASSNPNSASQYAPGQTGNPPPGQAAKATGQPANTFAPGQVKKSTSPSA